MRDQEGSPPLPHPVRADLAPARDQLRVGQTTSSHLLRERLLRGASQVPFGHRSVALLAAQTANRVTRWRAAQVALLGVVARQARRGPAGAFRAAYLAASPEA